MSISTIQTYMGITNNLIRLTVIHNIYKMYIKKYIKIMKIQILV